MDKIEPQAIAKVRVGGATVVLQMNAWQLLHREAGDLVTAEIVAVIPTEHAGG